MKTEKQVRTWWIDESDTHDGDIPIAFKQHPGQGPIQWQAQLIKVIAFDDHLAIVAELESRIAKLREALKRASQNIGDLCIYPEKRKWEHEKKEIELARQALKEDEAMG